MSALKLVIVGYGPVAARLLSDLEPELIAGRIHCTVIGAEDRPAYNRVLLSEVLAGRAQESRLGLSDPAELIAMGVDVRLGTRVESVERGLRQVRVSDGSTVRYDHLVLATGARPVVPTFSSVTPEQAMNSAGVLTLRTLDDLARIRAAATPGRRAVVLGGGVLGVEAATALASVGVSTILVHSSGHPMERQLDLAGGQLLERMLGAVGVEVVTGGRATDIHRGPSGGFAELLLHNGHRVAGDLLVLTCGVRARTDLATMAGLKVAGGIVVDHRLTSEQDNRIHAIGDCAEIRCQSPFCKLGCPPRGEPGTGPAGLIGPGWAQASILAEVLRLQLPGAPNDLSPVYTHRSDTVSLKAGSIKVTAWGEVSIPIWDSSGCELQVSQWLDPAHGRYLKVVSRHGQVTGAVCIGIPETAAELSMMADRGQPMPADPSVLLRFDGPDAGLGPVEETAETVICRCNAVTLGAVSTAIADGCRSVDALSDRTRAGTGCGGCRSRLAAQLAKISTEAPQPQEVSS